MKKPERLEMDDGSIAELSMRLDQRKLQETDYQQLKVILDTVRYLSLIVQQKATSIQRLLRMIFGGSTEKTSSVLGDQSPDQPPAETPATDEKEKPKRKGHGRRAAGTYHGAQKITVRHETLRAGCPCPACKDAKLYDMDEPAVLLRLYAQPIINATAYDLHRLRCATCGKVYTAKAPAEAGTEKYAPDVAPMIAAMRYGYGMPMNRIEQLQEDFGIPLPFGTQWELVSAHYTEVVPAWEEMIRQAASAEIFHNDDTTARILSVEKDIRAEEKMAKAEGKKIRTGVFTTGIVARTADRTITLFFSGRQHAGENLQRVLSRRGTALGPPIQMCDGLDRNKPATTKTFLSNCHGHGRRGFVDVVGDFPEECRHFLEVIREIYKFDAQAKHEGMNPDQRLLFHQKNSGPLMTDLRLWMERKIADKQVEPNSGLGEAMAYVLKRWEPLTLFLRKPGAPLDNNICERALKISIRHRNNSLFYKTEHGAHVGDLFMSVVHTCRLNQANPFHYLCTLRRHIEELRRNPADWMPWNYKASETALAGA